MQSQKLSLLSAILININIMLGSGVFINTTALTQQSGSLGALVYLIVGVLLLPLIMTIAQLLHHHQESGTFYDFGRSVSPFLGFVSSWGYFTGKLASLGLGVHVCLSFLQTIFLPLQAVPLLLLDSGVLLLFTFLNTKGLKAGTSIQYSFIFLKFVPIIFVILTGLFLAQGSSFSPETVMFAGIPSSIPLVLYAFSGFEASCSLSRHIVDHQTNGPRAILISFSAVLAFLFLFQLLFYATVGPSLGALKGNYLEAFPAFLKHIPFPTITPTIQAIMHIAIASSSLGSAYGIMYSNGWNLFTLAKNGHILAPSLFTKLNSQGIPVLCVVVQMVFALFYLVITNGNQIPLQQVGALGGTIAYTLSAFSLLILTLKKGGSTLLPLAGLGSCFLLIGSFIWTIVTKGPSVLLVLFLGLIALGTAMFYWRQTPDTLDVFEEL